MLVFVTENAFIDSRQLITAWRSIRNGV